MINFQDPSMFAAARAHVSSWRWRMGVGTLFAVGASFVLDSLAAGLGWFLAVMLRSLLAGLNTYSAVARVAAPLLPLSTPSAPDPA